jgi:peptidoglycan/LPS O-acetylase OafA/YrhL
MRNFIVSSWDLNPTLWFMQAIFGLYVLFPFLLALQKKHGLKSLLIVSVLIVCASRFIYVASGLQIDRESGFFLFYTLEFAIGMAIAATPKFSRLLKTGVSPHDPALPGSGECSHATAVTAGCLRREAGSERDGICSLEAPASSFKRMTALADGPTLVFKQPGRSNGISKGSVSAWCLLVAFAGYAVSYLLKIKIGIPANLHDVFTCIGSFALGIFSYQVLSFLKFEKIERAIGSIGELAFVIYLLHAPPIQHLIKPLLKRYYDNSQGILEVCAILIVYFAIVVLVSKPLARYLRAMSSKIEARI